MCILPHYFGYVKIHFECLGSWVLVHLWYRSSISAPDSVKIFCFRSASSMAAYDNGVAVQGLSQSDAVF